MRVAVPPDLAVVPLAVPLKSSEPLAVASIGLSICADPV